MKINLRKSLCWIVLLGLFVAVVAFGFIAWADHAAESAGEGILYEDAASVPVTPVALVFGCAEIFKGRPNLYFKARIEAAAALWKAGKVECFIVSGDNHKVGYNEPEDMRAAMVEAGVPEEKIVCDYAGLRTLDSVVRAKEIFGAEKVVLVSQKFHNERAAYLAEAISLDVVGLNAESVTGPAARKTNLREKLARVKMWLDVNILRTRPKHLGDKETLPVATR